MFLILLISGSFQVRFAEVPSHVKAPDFVLVNFLHPTLDAHEETIDRSLVVFKQVRQRNICLSVILRHCASTCIIVYDLTISERKRFIPPRFSSYSLGSLGSSFLRCRFANNKMFVTSRMLELRLRKPKAYLPCQVPPPPPPQRKIFNVVTFACCLDFVSVGCWCDVFA